MTTRRIRTKSSGVASPCPKCKNDREFIAHSQQVAEDGCEVWLTCICGHDPHGTLDRFEDPMGGCSDGNVLMAIECWNDAVWLRGEKKHA